MDTTAYLLSQGWLGPGHSLDQSSSPSILTPSLQSFPSTLSTTTTTITTSPPRGLIRPLLTSKKTDLSGVGRKARDFADQWWLGAFDRSLKDLGDVQAERTERRGVVKERDEGKGKRVGGLAMMVEGLGRWSGVGKGGDGGGGLYGGFVRGEGLGGTIGVEREAVVGVVDGIEGEGKKRRRRKRRGGDGCEELGEGEERKKLKKRKREREMIDETKLEDEPASKPRREKKEKKRSKRLRNDEAILDSTTTSKPVKELDSTEMPPSAPVEDITPSVKIPQTSKISQKKEKTKKTKKTEDKLKTSSSRLSPPPEVPVVAEKTAPPLGDHGVGNEASLEEEDEKERRRERRRRRRKEERDKGKKREEE